MKKFLRVHGPMAAFITLAIAGGIAIQESASDASQTLYRSQLATCNRSNQLRRESNRRIPAHVAEKNIVRALLVTAKTAREATGKPSDEIAATSYGLLIHQLDTRVKFHPLPLIDCAKIIPRP